MPPRARRARFPISVRRCCKPVSYTHLDIWVVRDSKREVLVPVIEDVVKAMDFAARRVTIEPIPGLLD